MRVDGGSKSIGYLHNIILTQKPCGHNIYHKVHNVHIDSNLNEISDNMIRLIRNVRKVLYISVEIDEQIYGLSYEMSLAMLLCGYTNICCSGIISAVNDDVVNFGPIEGLSEKRKLNKNIKTSIDIPSVTLLP